MQKERKNLSRNYSEMRKNKDFWCVVLVIGLVMVLSVVSPIGVASEYSTFEDYEFARWAVDKTYTYGTYCELKSSAAKSNDFDTLELLWNEEYDFCQNALIEIDQFYVSKEMQPLKNEFQLFLQYLKLSAHNWEKWYNSSSYDSNAYEKSIMYYDLAEEHYSNFSDLYENWRTAKIATPIPIATPTPTPALIPSPSPVYTASPTPTLSPTTTPMPGFNFLFAIIGVLAAIYLIKRTG